MRTKDHVALRPVPVSGEEELRYTCRDCGHAQNHNEVCDECGNCCGFKSYATDASPLATLAAFIALLMLVHGKNDAERSAEATWDLTKYRPEPKEW